MKTRRLLIVAISLFASSQAFATWTLDNARSSLSFVSTKAIDIAEVHHFSRLVGRVSDKGKAVITIELASVDTGIPIRDERMQEMLFEVDKFPLATVRAMVDMELVNALPNGDGRRIAVQFDVDLHGVHVNIDANVIVVNLDDNTLMVSSAEPVILSAATVELSAGIEALREVASLPSIGNAVPVSFILTFEKSE